VRLLVLSAVALQVVVPPILLFWLWRRTPSTRIEWLAGVAVVVSTIAVLSLVLPWSAVPWYVRHVHAAAALGVTVASWMQARHVEWFQAFDLRRWATFTTHGVLALLLSAVVVWVALGMAVPQGPRIDLACPFPSGVYLVVNGGNSRLLNSHLETLEPIARYAPWRGQSYGVDLVRLDGWGRRSEGLLPADPTRYQIHGQVVTAPCSGAVVSTVSDRPDMPVPVRDPDRTQLAGNHVLLDCAGTEVLLAHFLGGSVGVAPGDQVTTGQVLGVVGNSGNTTEPHLHVSAQRRAPRDALIGGTPVWVTIDGRYLVRNDRLECGRR
jgi:hypothetical protein